MVGETEGDSEPCLVIEVEYFMKSCIPTKLCKLYRDEGQGVGHLTGNGMKLACGLRGLPPFFNGIFSDLVSSDDLYAPEFVHGLIAGALPFFSFVKLRTSLPLTGYLEKKELKYHRVPLDREEGII